MFREGTIGKFAVDLMRSQPSLTNPQVLAEIRRKFPNARTEMNSIYWYRNKMRGKPALADDNGEPPEPELDDLVDDAVEATFGFERELQHALRRNIDQLESGLTIIDGGNERKVASGFIDITARDRSGATVAIELKRAGVSDRNAVGQILGSMGDLMEGTQSVRGILVAGEFSPGIIAAAKVVPNLSLVRYSFRFSFDVISPAAASNP
jgi:endonuclease NucS-like protein